MRIGFGIFCGTLQEQLKEQGLAFNLNKMARKMVTTENFEKDHKAIHTLKVKGYISDSEYPKVCKRFIKKLREWVVVEID